MQETEIKNNFKTKKLVITSLYIYRIIFGKLKGPKIIH